MKHILATIVVFLFLASGCGPSSRITSSWRAENVQPQKFKKVVVLGLIRENDRTLREKMEQHLVGDLKELGYDAVCSCDQYNPKAFENMGEEEAISKLHTSGVDAVLTIVLLDKMQERYYVPGRVVYSPYTIYQGRFWRYSRMMYDRIYTEGYYTTDTKYFWETNLYDLASNNLVYSSQSQSFDPVTSESLGHEYGQMIVEDMVKKNVLTDVKKEPVFKAM
ncbi:MAG: hypothetical protein IPP43_11100 [Chitinophagaceae bacterium]|nr:hypothetical protein [Chitinophagaceae bacterium]MBL0273748.1 hypothetical protein [Chitinophagaceae bacterium]